MQQTSTKVVQDKAQLGGEDDRLGFGQKIKIRQKYQMIWPAHWHNG